MAKKEGGSAFVSFIQAIGIIFGALVSLMFFLFILLFIIAAFIPERDLTGGNVAVVPIKGIISTDGSADFLEDGGSPSEDIIDWIEDADKDAGTKAILLEVDSPGGSPVATDEIARAVKAAEKPVIAVIRERGASGAFWIASAADYIIANKMSLTGSIGVTSSHLEFAGLLEDYNVTYRKLSAGRYKDAGSRWKEMTPEEEQLFQRMLNEVHAAFVEEIADNRNLPIETVRDLAHGFVFTGAQAKELGLVDALGTKDDAVAYIEQSLNITADLYEFKPAKAFVEELFGISSYHAGRGIGAALLDRAVIGETRITT
jgi:protease-4